MLKPPGFSGLVFFNLCMDFEVILSMREICIASRNWQPCRSSENSLIAQETKMKTDVISDRCTDFFFSRSKDQKISISQLNNFVPGFEEDEIWIMPRQEHRWTLKLYRMQPAKLICFNSSVISSVEIRFGLQCLVTRKC